MARGWRQRLGHVGRDTNGQVAMWAGFLFLFAVFLTGSAAALLGRRVRVLPTELLVGLSTVAQPRRRAAICLVVALVPQLWLAALMASPPHGMTENGHLILPAELLVLALWLVYLIRTPRMPEVSVDWRELAEAAARRHEYAERAPAPKPRAGIVWAIVGMYLVCLTIYAAFDTPALFGYESDAGHSPGASAPGSSLSLWA